MARVARRIKVKLLFLISPLSVHCFLFLVVGMSCDVVSDKFWLWQIPILCSNESIYVDFRFNWYFILKLIKISAQSCLRTWNYISCKQKFELAKNTMFINHIQSRLNSTHSNTKYAIVTGDWQSVGESRWGGGGRGGIKGGSRRRRWIRGERPVWAN